MNETPAGRSSLFVSSVDKAFNVLRAFDTDATSLSLTQISAACGYNLSMVQRFVYTLQTLGYLRKDPQTRHYSPSPKLLNLGTSYLRCEELARRATPYIRQASDRSSETISLLELDGSDVIHIIRYGAPSSVNTRILLGTRMPAVGSAGGRVIIANRPDEEAAAIIDGTEVEQGRNPPDRADIEESLAAARRDGYCIVNNTPGASYVTVAAPVSGAEHLAIASVEFTVPSERWNETARREMLLRLLIDTTQALSVKP
ncbi:IclR family transcriptional regulator [Oceanibacterium hippocampi]|uniref:Transcriptional regulator KdgR n=1 Tax=Oceanibacterium hippocampi TaxID=745714 RepID=A0A1Y5TWA3_9PROT|nr:IclR family transcriptional regulator [Oceanibacterium hippocampi]SLN71855.1 Transcriptional regulator KdgR [Oceanibacterium hippocampi]